jgi:NTP pyrophosphatase (non-canonical NTP hydrolase)
MKNTNQATLEELQAFIKQTCKERGWDNRSAVELFTLMTEEVGEVSKAIRHLTGFAHKAKTSDTKELAHELVDVLNYVLDIANHFDIDMAKAFEDKWSININRVWK